MAGRPKKEFDEMNVENLPIDSLKPLWKKITGQKR